GRVEPLRPRIFLDDRLEVAGMEAAFTRYDALFVGREPFDLPDREKKIRKGEWHPSKRAADDTRPALGSIEVHDVRELVREDQAQPIVGIADEIGSGRPDRCDDDRVARKRRR